MRNSPSSKTSTVDSAGAGNGGKTRVDAIEGPDQLSVAILEEVLNSQYCRDEPNAIKIKSFKLEPIEDGVLSLVTDVSLEYHEDSSIKPPDVPLGLVAKFLRKELPMPYMFRVEGNFYNGDNGIHSSAVRDCGVFRVPSAICSYTNFILLERIDGVTRYSCVDGCSSDEVRTRNIVKRLATMHARLWGYRDRTQALANPAGIGASLDGLTKEQQFPYLWEDFIGKTGTSLSEKETAQLRSLCRTLSERRLRKVHEKIQGEGSKMACSTLIHGDFHLANMLFREKVSTSEQELWLLDWAACGQGNPIREMTFFSIVCTDVHGSDAMELLQYYYSVLTDPSTSRHAHSIKEVLSFQSCAQEYKFCVLNQFIILVCYDKITRDLIAQCKIPDQKAKQITHFEKVNNRCIKALLSTVDVNQLSMLPRKTDDDIKVEEKLREMGDFSRPMI